MVAGEISPALSPVSQEEALQTISTQMENVIVDPNQCRADYDGEMICIKIKDILGSTPVCGMKTFLYRPSDTFLNLFDDASNYFQLQIGDFELVYQDKMDLYELSTMPPDLPLTAANLKPSREKEYSVTINKVRRGRKSRPTKANRIQKDPELEAIKYEAIESSQIKRDFVGLKNMNMTCYLNSVIQSLWFTPEFRNILYGFVTSTNGPKKSISHSLQKLFIKMQFSARESIETEELTSTFGWTNRDTWYQHDAEELCNLLMENLSLEFKDTPLEGVIEALYFGSFTDYVKCLSCSKRNAREAAFLVLPLPIRQFGKKLENPTLEDALATFINPELLDGSNQYRCDNCDKACDAHKGFLFKRLPYILTIQLKRYEVNWDTGRKYKLNDEIVFPMALDMNPYMDTSEKTTEEYLKYDVFKSAPRTSLQLRTAHSRPVVTMPVDEENTEANNEVCSLRAPRHVVLNALKEMSAKSGANVYQLFAVLVHRGGLQGGHYFAYILDFETFRWYRCDDAYVRKADIADIEACFGGDEEDKEPTSAYMLMYRRFDENTNSLPMVFDDLSQTIKDIWGSLAEEEKIAQEEEELERNNIRIPVYYRIRGSLELKSSEMYLLKAATTTGAALFVFHHMFPDVPDPPSDRIRVSRFDKDLGVIEASFDGQDDQYITYSLKHPPPVCQSEGLILEVIGDNESFYSYSSNDIVFFAQLFDVSLEEIVRVEELHCLPRHSVGQLRRLVAEKFNTELENTRIVLHDIEQKCLRPLLIDEFVLLDIGFLKINHIFVQSVAIERMSEFDHCLQKYINGVEFELEIDVTVGPSDNAATTTVPTMLTSDKFERVELSPPEHPVTCIQAPSSVCPILCDGDIGNVISEKETVPSTIVDETTQPLLEQSDSGVNTQGSTTKSEDVEMQSPTSPSSFVSSQDSSSEDMVSSGSEITVICEDSMDIAEPTYSMKIRPEISTSQYWKRYTVRVDSDMPVELLSRYMSRMLNRNEKDFIIAKVIQDEEVEVLNYSITFDCILPIEKLRIRTCRRLLKGEGRVSVFLLDIGSAEVGRFGTYIGDVALSGAMSTGDAKAAVVSQLNSYLDGYELCICRLRKKNEEMPSKVFRDWCFVHNYLNKIHGDELYIQILREPEAFTESNYAMFIRRWNPSSWELGPVEDLLLFYDHSDHIANVVRKRLHELTNIPEEDIEVAKPDSEIQFPFNMNPLAIHELTWFALKEPLLKSVYVYNDDVTLFIRNAKEALKSWTQEEEQVFRKDMNTENLKAISSPRKEVGLKIKMKSP